MAAKHANVARENISRAGLDRIVELRIGNALDTLPRLSGPFDLIFIDADKPGYSEYFKWALRLARPGSVIVADNVVRNGGVIDAASADANVQGIRRFNDLVASEAKVAATAIQTVGSKGYDGFLVAVVIDEKSP
jgi:predicted O-methyltransferase YrrM